MYYLFSTMDTYKIPGNRNDDKVKNIIESTIGLVEFIQIQTSKELNYTLRRPNIYDNKHQDGT